MGFIEQLYVRCRRFAHCRGFGIQSPSDFYLVTQVIYESLPYYAYQKIHQLHKVEKKQAGYCNPERVDRLLFRLVNYFQPEVIVDVETGTGWSAFCMGTACGKAKVFSYDKQINLNLTSFLPGNVSLHLWNENESKTLQKVDFLHIRGMESPYQVFETYYPVLSEQAVCVFEGIHDGKKNRENWKKIREDERVRITFDLYSLGIVILRKDRIKQNYIINY